MTIELGILLGVVGTVSGMVVGWAGFYRAGKKTLQDDVTAHTRLSTDISYIKNGIDDIRIDLKAQELRVTDLATSVVRLEESTKSAHKRIDKIEGGGL